MKIDIPQKQADDPQFVEIVSRVLSGLLSANPVERTFVIRIDNWFDHKWLNFSGIGRVKFDDTHLNIDTALDEFRQKKVTLPPFTPRRVTGESHFVRDTNGVYSLCSNKPHVHERKLAPSSRNLHKRVVAFTDSALFVWFSSNTDLNRRGSIMVYEVNGAKVCSWYAALSKGKDEWRFLKTKGIASEEIQSMLEHE